MQGKGRDSPREETASVFDVVVHEYSFDSSFDSLLGSSGENVEPGCEIKVTALVKGRKGRERGK